MSSPTSSEFWKGKRVFLTYPTHFLGAWTALSLEHLGAQVFGFAEATESVSSSGTVRLFDLANLGQRISMTYGDLRDEETLRQALQFAEADIVLHLGEMGLLTDAEKKPLEILSKSVMGTGTLMELLRETASVRSVVVAGSDKVYARTPDNRATTENDKVAAGDVFPTAKLCAEFVALSYRSTFFTPAKYNKHKVAIATARMGSAIGGGDFAENSLISQAVQSFIGKKTFEVRNPHSVRPWIHVLDQVAGLLSLAQALFDKGPRLAETYNLAAVEFESVGEVVKEFAHIWGDTRSSMSGADAGPSTLSLHGQMSGDLAAEQLGWKPQWDLTKALTETARWYQDYYSGNSSPEQLGASVRGYFS
ncbi:GDP-mannose 4,6-dehydratase [Bdellovibrio sp. 22V]|uniref:GDP-mannose 4,6-dehydratase n=1 Tax=Bdellovibrio sp. 22V TaxID=3044166 RepID=UPI002543DE88|nr:GDP-mannose 4,6-dehydratase [Bdellovibrio sp. 22V]WII71849.1 GDP-mannose 4,6-dehydratase [Bdellovibrio sp. 22V]